jgi:hypothetical protein
MRTEHAIRALLLHATPMGDNCVSACKGTAMTVLVCRTISPVRPSHLNNRAYTHIRMRLASCVGRSKPSALSRLSKLHLSIRSQPHYGKVELWDHARSRRLISGKTSQLKSPCGVCTPTRTPTLEFGRSLKRGSVHRHLPEPLRGP